MIRRIVYREILENLVSLRFVLSLLLAVLLFAAGGFAFAAQHRQRSQDYWRDTNKNLSGLSQETDELWAVARYEQTVYAKPKVLSLCAAGFEECFPDSFGLNAFSLRLPLSRDRDDFTAARSNDMDWVFLVSMILSFIALVFTYDSVCGERESGTLRLVLSGSIPRHTILLGKYLGAMLILGIPLVVGLSVSVLVVLASGGVGVSLTDWPKILAVVLVSFLYLSAFVLLGMLVSSRTSHSANSMVLLLLSWVGLVILIPSFGRVISDAACKSPTQGELARRLGEMERRLEDEQNQGKFGPGAGVFVQGKPPANAPGTAQWANARTDARNQIYEDHLNRMIAPAVLGRMVTRISPAVLYQHAAEVLAGTGIARYLDLYQQIKRYQQELKEYVRAKDAQDPESLHLLCDHYQAITQWGVVSKKPVDLDGVPKFSECDLPLGASLRSVVWDIGLLALFNLALFAGCFVSFLRYDVR